MDAPRNTTMAGMLVGSIAQNAPPLVYCLHRSAKDGFVTDVGDFPQYRTSDEILLALRQTLGLRIWDIQTNDAIPCWYYVQLDSRWPARRLHCWELPITVYGGEWRQHIRK